LCDNKIRSSINLERIKVLIILLWHREEIFILFLSRKEYQQLHQLLKDEHLDIQLQQ
jgi:hypothetical protein